MQPVGKVDKHNESRRTLIACDSFSLAAFLMNGARTPLLAAGDVSDTNSIISGTNNCAGGKASGQTWRTCEEVDRCLVRERDPSHITRQSAAGGRRRATGSV